MEPSSFSLKGIELGKLVLTSGILHTSWSKISEPHDLTYENHDSTLKFETHEEGKLTIVVFATPRIRRRNVSLESASTSLSGPHQNPFPFLCSEKISSFSVHTPAYELFSSALEDLTLLKSKLLESKKPVIITGAALGGCVAALFTLWLREPKVEPGLKHLLCITFGSPLIGDASLQKVLKNSVRNSCFLHVAQPKTYTTEVFKPFGTFFICNGSEFICTEDAEAVTELLSGADTDIIDDYGDILHGLDQTVLSMEDSTLIPDDVFRQMKKRAKKKKLHFDLFKKLNDMKIEMMHLEWYKKESKMDYYDRFKTGDEVDQKFEVRKEELNAYWKDLVEEVKKKPQSDVSILSRRFLFAGNNYRRMVEPLDIAVYYREGEKKYREVEEAVIVINQLKAVDGMSDEALIKKLVQFEEYVWGLIGKREVSPEIFLEQSTFMSWWKEYEIRSSTSDFTDFMKSKRYKKYGRAIEA